MNSSNKKLFDHVIFIWINKPQVIHKKIFAARTVDLENATPNRFTRTIFLKDESTYSENIEIQSDNIFRFDGEDSTYCISLQSGKITVTLPESNLQKSHSLFPIEWLKSDLVDRLNRWYQQECLRPSLSSIPPSLSLLDIQLYQSIQNRLKKKYGKVLCDNWSERTDPSKFVYEDISIAAYLMTLWHDDVKESLYFIDIGCGNGLLVFLLISEGFRGHGVDIRERAIWKTYPEIVRSALKEETFIPSAANLFTSKVTWLIGNHSDELTPWIPVMAAKSHSHIKVFLLPCCSFDFHCKFDAGGRTTSCYRAYLDFVAMVMSKCGFSAKEDLLRIPSTKRTCFVGYPQYEDSERANILTQIDNLILSRAKPSSNPLSKRKLEERTDEARHDFSDSNSEVGEEFQEPDDSVPFHPEFKPRDKMIANRNCSSLDVDLRVTICLQVFNRLLQEESWITTEDGRQWNRGGEMHLTKVSELFHTDTLKKLKNEHGGIGTLLKNHHQIFHVQKGQVRLRYADSGDPIQAKRRKKELNLKTKPCWMFHNHPQCCPFTNDICNFVHDDNMKI